MGKYLHPVNILYYLCKTNQGQPHKINSDENLQCNLQRNKQIQKL
jgi:hypothetical protein